MKDMRMREFCEFFVIHSIIVNYSHEIKLESNTIFYKFESHYYKSSLNSKIFIKEIFDKLQKKSLKLIEKSQSSFFVESSRYVVETNLI